MKRKIIFTLELEFPMPDRFTTTENKNKYLRQIITDIGYLFDQSYMTHLKDLSIVGYRKVRIDETGN